MIVTNSDNSFKIEQDVKVFNTISIEQLKVEIAQHQKTIENAQSQINYLNEILDKKDELGIKTQDELKEDLNPK